MAFYHGRESPPRRTAPDHTERTDHADRVVISAVPPVSNTGPSSFRIPVSAIAIIPARYESTRLPGKALAEIAGRPMIEHVYRRAAAASLLTRVIVATDDARIFDAVRAFGGEAVMTDAAHQSG